jgi:hypothetical protein
MTRLLDWTPVRRSAALASVRGHLPASTIGEVSRSLL